jgi:hypothetical protein
MPLKAPLDQFTAGQGVIVQVNCLNEQEDYSTPDSVTVNIYRPDNVIDTYDIQTMVEVGTGIYEREYVLDIRGRYIIKVVTTGDPTSADLYYMDVTDYIPET